MRRLIPFLVLFFIVAAWVLALQNIPFFWDSVQLGSKHAHHFFRNGLAWTPLPNSIDSGHPPFFGFYLATMWTFLGKSLVVSHWAMFPFLLGIAWLSYALGLYLSNAGWALGLIPVIFLDPVVAGQSTLVGPDIVLACFFLLAVWSLLSEKKTWAMVAVLGLCLISMRGMMTAAALFLWQILLPWILHRRFPNVLRISLVFAPGFMAAITFLAWHHQQTGWIGFHPNSPWATAFEHVNAGHFLKNILVLAWRWLDFGRIFEWIVLLVLIIKILPWKNWGNHRQGQMVRLILLFACLLVFLSPSALLYNNLSAHRYFLPLFLCFHLLVFHWLATTALSKQFKKGLWVFMVLGLGTGNLWIYPQGVSMDWDATLAHLPYHRLRAEMMDYIDSQNIDYAQIGTAFPNINTGEDLLLNGDPRKCVEKDFLKNQYVLLSNIYNDFSAADYRFFEKNWTLIKRLKQSGVWINLYQKNGTKIL